MLKGNRMDQGRMMAPARIIAQKVQLGHEAHRPASWQTDRERKNDPPLDGVVPQAVLVRRELDKGDRSQRGLTAIVPPEIDLQPRRYITEAFPLFHGSGA